MARRRSSSAHSVSFAPLVVAALIAAGGWAAWHFRDRLLPKPATPPRASAAALDVCALAPRARIARALGVSELEARHVGAAADVPAAGACTFEFARDGRAGSVVVLAFTSGSLSRGGSRIGGHDYYTSVVTGLEYALKDVPAPVAGLGDEAATAGFADGAGPAQLVARRGDTVLHLVVRGASRDAAVGVARELLAAR